MNLNKTALLLIDLQKESKYGLINDEKAIQNARLLIRECRGNNIPIIYTRHINRQDGVALAYKEPLDDKGEPIFYNSQTEGIEIIDAVKPKAGDLIIDKYRWSAFYDTHLELALQSLQIEHLIIGGFVTDGCVMASVFDAFTKNYQINLVKDICATTSSGAHMSSILIMCNWVYGIEVFDAEEMSRKIRNQEYRSWKWETPDELKFTEKNLMEIYKLLDN